eukprot:TRINITY_DN81150_c0_g1_i1.p1 TRINITY_DN81150_c0_g1~~TRINITY_DN81150_c0_g1_i1.p1  ORF type:complete len:114 (-),score=23.40 TRINITY_DN81150_c0_g1_i1:304-645(-)
MARSAGSVLSMVLLGTALLAFFCGSSASSFVQPSDSQANLRASAALTAGVAGSAAGSLPAFAGEPPSVGEHWYWNVGVGTLHGETASIIFLVFFLLVVVSLLGFGGSSKKASA